MRYLLIGMALGVLTEVSARGLRLWVYRRSVTPAINILVMFGAVMGGIAAGARSFGFLPAFLLGAAVGLAYEVANLWRLDWWYFPGERLAFVRGHTAIVAVLSLLWGTVPPAIALVHGALSCA